MTVKTILSEASTTINLYYRNPEWQSIVQDLHRRHHLNPKVVWEEEPIQRPAQLANNFPRDPNRNEVERKTYLLIYDDYLFILGKTGPRSISAFKYNYDTKQGRTESRYELSNIKDLNQAPRAVFSTPLNSSQVIKVKSQILTDKKQYGDEINLVYSNMLRFIMPIMNKMIIKAIADSEGMMIQYARSGNYNAAQRKLDSLKDLSKIRNLINISRPIDGIERTDAGSLYNKLGAAVMRYYEELHPENVVDGAYNTQYPKNKGQYLEWLKSIQNSKPALSNILHHFRERLLR